MFCVQSRRCFRLGNRVFYPLLLLAVLLSTCTTLFARHVWQALDGWSSCKARDWRLGDVSHPLLTVSTTASDGFYFRAVFAGSIGCHRSVVCVQSRLCFHQRIRGFNHCILCSCTILLRGKATPVLLGRSFVRSRRYLFPAGVYMAMVSCNCVICKPYTSHTSAPAVCAMFCWNTGWGYCY